MANYNFTEFTPFNRLSKHLSLVITLATPTAMLNFVQICPQQASGQMSEI